MSDTSKGELEQRADIELELGNAFGTKVSETFDNKFWSGKAYRHTRTLTSGLVGAVGTAGSGCINYDPYNVLTRATISYTSYRLFSVFCNRLLVRLDDMN